MVTGFLMKRRDLDIDIHTQGKHQVRLKAKIRVMFLETKITQGAPKPRDARGKEQSLSISPPKETTLLTP